MISKATMSVCKCSSRRVQNIVLSSHGGKLAMYSSGLYYRRAFSNTSSDGSADSAATDAPASPEAESQTAIAKLTKEVKDLKDQLMRSYAEEENVRRIAKRDVENAKSFSNEKFAKSMLEVADDLERALSVVPPEVREKAKAAEDPTLNTLVEGLVMTEKNLQKLFLSHSIVRFGQVGDAFSPSLHDALFQIPDPSRPANTIGQVLKPGYKLKERVIRAAQVGAIVAP